MKASAICSTSECPFVNVTRTEFVVLRTTYGMFDENGQLKKQPKVKKPEAEKREEEGISIIFD